MTKTSLFRVAVAALLVGSAALAASAQPAGEPTVRPDVTACENKMLMDLLRRAVIPGAEAGEQELRQPQYLALIRDPALAPLHITFRRSETGWVFADQAGLENALLSRMPRKDLRDLLVVVLGRKPKTSGEGDDGPYKRTEMTEAFIRDQLGLYDDATVGKVLSPALRFGAAEARLVAMDAGGGVDDGASYDSLVHALFVPCSRAVLEAGGAKSSARSGSAVAGERSAGPPSPPTPQVQSCELRIREMEVSRRKVVLSSGKVVAEVVRYLRRIGSLATGKERLKTLTVIFEQGGQRQEHELDVPRGGLFSGDGWEDVVEKIRSKLDSERLAFAVADALENAGVYAKANDADLWCGLASGAESAGRNAPGSSERKERQK